MRRWEAARGLPVHRVPGGGRSGVFAYVSELQQWLELDRLKPPAPADLVQDDPEESSDPGSATLAGLYAEDAQLESESVDASSAERLPFVRRHAVKLTWSLSLCLAVAATLAGSIHYAKVAGQAGPHPDPRLDPHGAAARPATPEAQELYLRGQYLVDLRTEASILQAVDLFTQAIVHDPRFAAAYAGLAESYILLRQYGRMLDAEAFPRALAASRQALVLDPNSPQALRDHAFLLNYWIWDAEAANREFERSIELRPEDALTHHWYATSLYSQARFAQAMQEIDKARQLQPNSISILANRGLLLAATDEDAALAYLQELEKVNPDFPTVPMHLAGVYFVRNDWRNMLAEYRKAATLRKDAEELELLQAANRELQQHGAHTMLRLMAERYSKLVEAGRPNALQPALFYAKLGDQERALRYLRIACDRREAGFLGFYKEKVFSPLKQRPEFQDLVARSATPLDLATALRTRSPAP